MVQVTERTSMDNVEIGQTEGANNRIDLSIENNGLLLPARINVDAQMLGITRWAELMQKTRETGKEHGVIVSSRKQKLSISQTTEGHSQEIGLMTLKSLLPGTRNIASVHTHPQTEEDKHLSVSAISAQDIQSYASGTHRAMVMLNNGGAHMLTGRAPYTDLSTVNGADIFAQALAKAKGDTKSMGQVRTEIAESLSKFGIRYYFTPDTTPSPDGTLQFADVRIPPVEDHA